MFDNLSNSLEGAFKTFTGDNKITEINVATSLKEIRRALVGADVNYKIAKEFTEKVKVKALGTENVLNAVKPGQLMVKIVQDELTELMEIGCDVDTNSALPSRVVSELKAEMSQRYTDKGSRLKDLKGSDDFGYDKDTAWLWAIETNDEG